MKHDRRSGPTRASGFGKMCRAMLTEVALGHSEKIGRAVRHIRLLKVSVVVLVVCILLVAMISRIYLRVEAAKVGRRGQIVAMGILGYRLDVNRPGFNIWPHARVRYSGDAFGTYGPTSTDYFMYLCNDSPLTISLEPAIFGGGGVPEAKGHFLRPENNAWKVVAGMTDHSPDLLPFLFTRNVMITTEDIRRWPGGIECIPLDPDAKPFGDRLGVIVTKAGGVKILTANRLTWDAVYDHWPAHSNLCGHLEVWDVD